MSVLEQLSSSVGELTQEANGRVAERCLAEPDLLVEIVTGLGAGNARLAGDCAEVLTKVAEKNPQLAAPHAGTLATLLAHKNGRVRWESAHALALVASRVPDLVGELLPSLATVIRSDTSVIVRDYVVDAVAGYGTIAPRAAMAALPILREALVAWEGKHAARVLRGLVGVLAAAPHAADEIVEMARPFSDHSRAGVRKAASSLLRAAARR